MVLNFLSFVNHYFRFPFLWRRSTFMNESPNSLGTIWSNFQSSDETCVSNCRPVGFKPLMRQIIHIIHIGLYRQSGSSQVIMVSGKVWENKVVTLFQELPDEIDNGEGIDAIIIYLVKVTGDVHILNFGNKFQGIHIITEKLASYKYV